MGIISTAVSASGASEASSPVMKLTCTPRSASPRAQESATPVAPPRQADMSLRLTTRSGCRMFSPYALAPCFGFVI
jgi:hypothetical protein